MIPVSSWFPESLFNIFPERLRSMSVLAGLAGLAGSVENRRLDCAPKLRYSVLHISCNGFIVMLPSISSETWVMYSSVIPRTNVFCDWLFLALFFSLEQLPNFAFSLALP